ncbi:MAG: protein BatD [Bacteroidales bacterium]|nr:protein BatD [Bacteroidales bacterium]
MWRALRRMVSLFVALAMVLPAFGRSLSAEGKSEEGIRLVATLSAGRAVVGADVLYEVAVISPVASISLMKTPYSIAWGGLKATPVSVGGNLERVKIKGKEMYRAVIASYWLSASEAGKYTVPSADYTIGLAKERIVRDPFFGNMRSSYYEPLALSVPELSFKVDALPKIPEYFDFSGAVGEFEVSVWIPDGYIEAGSDAVAVVTVSGAGDLAEADTPSLLDAFSSTARLKSVSEERSRFIRNGRLWSEIELEVTFVPYPDDEGISRILPVVFGYFSPEQGKYLKAVSDPVDVPLSGKSGKSRPPVSIGV